jgi:superfamily II DNA or RNA helicase
MTFPEIYIMSMGYYPNGDKREAKKIGATWNGSSRKVAFTTTHTKRPKFDYLFRLDSKQFQTKRDLYDIDSVKFPEFLKTKGIADIHVPCEKGAGKEFYWAEYGLVNILREFLISENLTIVEEIAEDPYPLREYTHDDFMKFADEEYVRNTKVSLFDKFCRVFLEGKTPRRIQTELWNTFKTLTEDPDKLHYRGIVQWPTGVGKTFGTLMMIVLAAERCKARGEIYRGMFVSPKNDILDTILKHFKELSKFDIALYDGSHGKLSKLSLPLNSHILVCACHAALTSQQAIEDLPPMTHVHYDEVHRITGDEYFKLLKGSVEKWDTEFLTGTSATPKTCSKSQHEKLAELFGAELNILHRCDVDEAVREGWIAKPRFVVDILKKSDSDDVKLNSYLSGINKTILQRKARGLWNGGKIISYVGSIRDALYCIEHALEFIPDGVIYGAVDDHRTDKAFVDSHCDGTVRILFACQRFREGSDVRGLEMTAVLVGNSTAAYILLQISGRALRNDYEGKEGWCLIARPCEDGETEDDVYVSILLDVLEFISKSDKKCEYLEVKRLVQTYLNVNLDGKGDTVEDTIKRIQAIYVRNAISRGDVKSKYERLRNLNAEMGLKSRIEYEESKDKHVNFIEDPVKEFQICWTSWYDFLGLDTSKYPPTKNEWKKICMDNGWTTREVYNEKRSDDLPMNPTEFYPTFESWSTEFPQEEEVFW